MIKYLNGVISSKYIQNEQVLRIFISQETGQDIKTNLQKIIKEYSKYISCIELVGCETDQLELFNIVHSIKKEKIRTSWKANLSDISHVNKKLADELDYIELNTQKYKKEYSPFGDAEVWIDL